MSLAGLVGNGLHAWQVVTRDVAGNSHVARAPSPVVVDTAAPTVDLDPLPQAYVSRLQIGFAASDNLQATLGLGDAEIAVNTATDGTQSGAWDSTVTPVQGAMPGRNARDVALTSLPDGDHALRLRVRNGAPFSATLVADRIATVRVDNTTPVFPEPPTFATPTPGSLRVSFVAHDALAGVAGAALEWRDGTVWRPLGRQAAANGAGEITGDTSQLPEGATAFRLVVTDGAGNVATATSSLGVDRTAPSVSGLTLAGGPPWVLSWTQADGPAGAFGSCPTQVRVSGPGTGFGWREIVSRRLGEGAQDVVLPLDGLAPGAYRVGVVACDAAGNTTAAETAGLVVAGGSGSGSGSGDSRDAPTSSDAGGGSASAALLARLRGARLAVSMDRARVTRRVGRLVLVRRIAFGARVVVRGALRETPSLAGIPDIDIEVSSPRGRVIGRIRTDRAGRFALPVQPDASGLLRVGVPAGGRLLPERADADLRVLVAPRVSLRTSSRHAVALGAPVVLSGRLSPAPRRVGAGRKAIVLEWRDPVRHAWRPALNASTRADGTFRLSWRFLTRGLRTRLRVRVVPERGWPLQGAVSRSVAVDVR
jgi:hypothetical protein